MVETITPMVHGGSRIRWAGAVAAHTLASTAVAAAFGAVLALVGRVLGAPWDGAWWPPVAVVAFAAAAHELFGMPFPIPQLRRQVPDWWRTFFGPYVAAALYGGALGVGFLTFVTRATLVVVAVTVVATGHPAVGAVLMAPFGSARGLGAIAAGSADPHVVERLARIGAGRLPAVVNALALALVGAATVASRPAFEPRDAADLAAGLLAATFAWSAAWKVLSPSAWRRVVVGHRLGAFGRVATVAVPVLEAAIPVMYVLGYRGSAALTAVALLVPATAVVVRSRVLFGPRLACGCFGEGVRDYRTMLARNAALLLLAGVATSADVGTPIRLTFPRAGDAAPAVLAFAGVVSIAWAVASVTRELRRDRVAS